ncbi:MAG: PilZ domain-containing protein [Holophaga sp.]
MGGSGRTVGAIPGVLTLQLPDALGVMERRAAPRARLNPKEGATLTALQDLLQGVGITGVVENLSGGGAKVRVEKAMAVGTEKRLVLGTSLVRSGQKFLMLKLNKVPRCPAAMEPRGQAVYLVHEPGGLMMGLRFDPPAPAVAAALRTFVAQRCKPIPARLPARIRRRPGPAPEEAGPGPEQGGTGAEDGTQPLTAWPAADSAERRHHPRLSLGPGFQARFMAGDLLVPEADLLDLSAGGCCLRLPLERCREIRRGVDLEEFHLLHPDLPKGVLPARVSWVLGRNPGALETGRPDPGRPERYCLAGVEFTGSPDRAARAIAAYVARNLKGG